MQIRRIIYISNEPSDINTYNILQNIGINVKTIEFSLSFIGVPDITQDPYSTEVKISWNDTILHVSKCVDYFYVEHVEVENG